MLDDRDPLPVRSPIRLELHLGPETLPCSGVVTRCEPDSGMAVRFVEVQPTVRAQLRSYLTRLVTAENRDKLNVPERKPAAPTSASHRLGELLVRRGYLTADQLEPAVVQHDRHGGLFTSMLVRLGAASEEDLVRWLCREYRLPIIDVTGVAPMSQALARVPYEMAERHAILPLGIDGSTLTVAIADPSNLDGLNEVKFCSGCTLRIGISATLTLEHAIAQFYGAKMTRAAS